MGGDGVEKVIRQKEPFPACLFFLVNLLFSDSRKRVPRFVIAAARGVRDFVNINIKGKNMSSSRFVITVIGLDRVGIVAGISRVMAEHNVNIADIRQTIMGDLFTMIMLAEVKSDKFDLAAFQESMSAIGTELGVQVIVQHEDVFRFMHRI
ncbi:MAG TPA: ACT domain-containing protein [Geobacteraceae bacterium]|nr:ACT domain-containing protein [Geobacteraceae bacterium]